MELAKLTQSQFEQFRDFIYAKSGIRVDERKITLLSNRIRQRLKARDIADFDTYYRWLRSPLGHAELEHFLDAITTNETFFFRTPAHFEWLKTDFLTEVLTAERNGLREKKLKIWSAGCATGAEPYTMALCLAENKFRLTGWDLSIVGTDISEKALKEARAGIYKQRSIESVSTAHLRRYFSKSIDGAAWTVKPEVRALVRFYQHNLLTPFLEGPFDCIFIRNVLIYFDEVSKRKVIETLLQSLVNGGYLVVGPSEGIYNMIPYCEKIKTFLHRKIGKPTKE